MLKAIAAGCTHTVADEIDAASIHECHLCHISIPADQVLDARCLLGYRSAAGKAAGERRYLQYLGAAYAELTSACILPTKDAFSVHSAGHQHAQWQNHCLVNRRQPAPADQGLGVKGHTEVV